MTVRPLFSPAHIAYAMTRSATKQFFCFLSRSSTMVGPKADTLRKQKIRAAKKAAQEENKLRMKQRRATAKEGEVSL